MISYIVSYRILRTEYKNAIKFISRHDSKTDRNNCISMNWVDESWRVLLRLEQNLNEYIT